MTLRALICPYSCCNVHFPGTERYTRSWNIQFNGIIKELDFSQNTDESYVYKKDSGSAVVFLILYVNDILLNGNDISLLY